MCGAGFVVDFGSSHGVQLTHYRYKVLLCCAVCSLCVSRLKNGGGVGCRVVVRARLWSRLGLSVRAGLASEW